LKLEIGNYTIEKSPLEFDKQLNSFIALEADENDNCTIVNVESSISTNLKH
jgi:hypothetical protein